MADLLAKWLNEDIKLSEKITNFENDFSSGYLLGELLYKFNQLDNFNEFSQKDNISTKVKNFEKLEPTLRNLNIKFDSQHVDKIMKKERGYALRLLYQLKMILEKVYPPTDITILRKTGKNGDAQPALKIGSQKQAYNSMQSGFFRERLQTLNKPQKTTNMERHLKKFSDEADRQATEAKRFHEEQNAEKERHKQEIRRAQINKLQRNAGFMEEWLQKGVEDWKQNMAYKKEREQSHLEFEYRQAQKDEQATIKRVDAARREVADGIAQFERTLAENNINPEVTAEFANSAIDQIEEVGGISKATLRTQKMTQSLLSKPTMGLGGTMTKNGGITLGSVGLRSKAKKPLDAKQRKDRERRRMRMIADQMTLLTDIEKARREEEVLERMKRQSKQEEELAYEAWRTTQCKHVIEKNRELREAKYQQRQELDTQNAVFKERHMLDSMLEQMHREIDTLKERDDFLRCKDKEAKKGRQTHECSKMLDAIFDIAHEAYIHQQKQDSGEIDPRNWHEWEQLFIEGVDIVEASKAPEGSDVDVELTTSTAATELDRLELVDYLQCQGQWPTSLVTDNKPKLETILGAPDAGAPAGKGGKGAKGATPADTMPVEEGDLAIEDEPTNNTYVGDAVEQIINLNYEARGRQLRPKNPHYLNLKLCLVGYAFAGKRTQAARLKEAYGLETLTMHDLVEEALKFYQDHPDPIVKVQEVKAIQESIHEDSREDLPKNEEPNQADEEKKEDEAPAEAQDEKPPAPEEEKDRALRENPMFRRSGPLNFEGDEDAKSEASEIEEELNPDEDFRKCGQKIQECLFDGSEIPDQLYVDLFVAKLRKTYEIKDRDTLAAKLKDDAKRELLLTRELASLGAEVAELKSSSRKSDGSKRSKKRTLEVVQKEIEEKRAELLDIKVVENTGWVLVDFPTNFSQAMLLERALSGYNIPEDLDPTQRENECREAQLLTKPTEKPVPPKVLTPSGIDAVIWFESERPECLRRALGRRVDGNTGIDYHIEDRPPSIEQSPLCEVIEPIDNESESTACLLDRWVAFDQYAHGLEKWLTQFGDEETSSNLLTRIDANGTADDTFNHVDSVLKDIIRRKMRKQGMLRATLHANIIREDELEQERLRAEKEDAEARKAREDAGEGSQGGVTPGPPVTRSMIGSKSSMRDGSQFTASDFVHERDNIDDDFKGTLMALWRKISTSYRSQMQLAMKKQRSQRDEIQNHLHKVQQQFLLFLQRLDAKQQVLSKFITDFNKFSDDYPDMREDEQTKEELHQRVDTLSDELWEIAEERREQAVDERKKIMESGWVENAQEFVTTVAQMMMQSEVDKYRGTVQLLWDYYHAIDEKLIPAAEDIPAVDIMGGPEGGSTEILPVEQAPEGADATDASAYTYPRLDDLYKRSVKAQAVPDVVAAAQAANEAKKGGKKDAKGKGAAPADAEETKDSVYLKEMKEAIRLEKSILRYRLTQVRNWSLKRLKLQRQKFLTVYKKLEDWIAVSSRAENDAIEEVCDVVKEAIESQAKIQDELRIKFMDFVVDKSYHNYIDPPPPKLEAMEEARSNRFSVPQLQAVIVELRQLAGPDNMIRDRAAVDLLARKSANSKALGDLGGLPKDWANFKMVDFERMVRNLDIYNEGVIDYRALATCFVLLQSQLPKDEHVDDLRKAVKETQVPFELFNAQNFWFNRSEVSKDRDYSHKFDRTAHIRQTLFDLYRQDSDCMDMLAFVRVVKSIGENYRVHQQKNRRAVVQALGPKAASKIAQPIIGDKFYDVLTYA